MFSHFVVIIAFFPFPLQKIEDKYLKASPFIVVCLIVEFLNLKFERFNWMDSVGGNPFSKIYPK